MKIENVINSCSDCKHCQVTKELNGNTFYAVICTMKEENNFLLDVYSSDPKHFITDIPDSCPLEDYQI